jgi:alpha-tubulin suppressor-like RCC1 family protein
MLPPGTKAKAIRAGCEHNLAITTDCRLLAWGFNGNGELGNGTTTDSDTPVQVKLPRVKSISAGFEHSLAVTTKGKVLAWGSNSFGQLGDGTTTDSDTPVRVRLPKRTKVRGLFAGCFHSLARTSKGHVLAWGGNNSGELGIGTISGQRDLPRRVKLHAGLSARAIGSGPDALFSLAIVRKAKR